MSRDALKRIALWMLLSAALLVGWLLFPRALEPGRSAANGVTLNRLVDQGSRAAPNDWFRASPYLGIANVTGGLRLNATRAGYQLVSRSLPIFAGTSYRLTAEANDVQGRWTLAVYDNLVHRELLASAFESGKRTNTLSVRFGSGGRRRVALVLSASRGSTLVLSRVSLLRIR